MYAHVTRADNELNQAILVRYGEFPSLTERNAVTASRLPGHFPCMSFTSRVWKPMFDTVRSLTRLRASPIDFSWKSKPCALEFGIALAMIVVEMP